MFERGRYVAIRSLAQRRRLIIQAGERKSGSAVQIKRMLLDHPGTEIRYTLIGGHRTNGCIQREGITCEGLAWECLLPSAGYKESTLATDLFDTLSHFGVRLFATRNMKPNFADQASQAMNLYDALARVIQQFGGAIARSD